MRGFGAEQIGVASWFGVHDHDFVGERGGETIAPERALFRHSARLVIEGREQEHPPFVDRTALVAQGFYDSEQVLSTQSSQSAEAIMFDNFPKEQLVVLVP